VIGTALAAGSQNNGVIPIAKNLWSLSFVLVMAGMGYLILLILHEVVDRRQWWNGAPFRVRENCFVFGNCCFCLLLFVSLMFC
jgi:predicted acyltransferase